MTVARPRSEASTDGQSASELRKLREDFPILAQKVNGKPLAYLDNAATTQKPQEVIDAIRQYYTWENANIHRGIHYLSEKATAAYEKARVRVQRFLGAARTEEIVFVRGTTEGINLVASSYGRTNLRAGDEILITHMEHHSNIVPWQIVCEETGAVLKVVPINDRGEVILEEYERLLSPKTRLVSVVHISNALGTVNPIRHMVQLAHGHNAAVLVDGAQTAGHNPVDVQDLDCDFFVFSGHKVFGPTGVGALYGKNKFLESMPPYQSGGGMISSVTFERTNYKAPPDRFEAGTPNIAGVVALSKALEYVEKVGRERIAKYEAELLQQATERVHEVAGLQVIGTAKNKASILSFVLDGAHPHDIATVLDQEGVAVRAGHHCAQPAMEYFGVPATVRASLAFYNTEEDIDALIQGLHRVREVLR